MEQSMNENRSSRLSTRRIDRLFLQLAAIYPYKWSGQFPEGVEEAVEVAKYEWFEGLNDLTEFHIKRGIEKCRKIGGSFPPSIPEFRKLCLLTLHELGILPIEEAYEQFCKKDFTNPIVEDIYLKIGSWNYKTLSAIELRKRFNTCYHMVCDKYLMESKEGRQLLERKESLHFLENHED